MKNAADHIRYDLKIIADLVAPNSKVLDIGCGNGELLYYLRSKKNVDGKGMELSQAQVSKALARGLSVIQGNAENDLIYYPDKSFDYAILSHTIQATHNPPAILREMMRISKYVIVSLPNFAHVQNRLQLMFKGKMPVNKRIPFEWYETPNIHFCSIRDFEDLCSDLQLNIAKEIFIAHGLKFYGILNKIFVANLFAEHAIFLLDKTLPAPTWQEELSAKGKRIVEQKLTPRLARERF